ncbi:hypothetical protein AAF712_014386 [Marasmius tenuissimus]|uniref:ubiquitinyl hydrolase 1 n=1 Tax=Marasmius tenuissimus TaxID=585030 RepID=A0ABR2ZDA4_9AGAR
MNNNLTYLINHIFFPPKLPESSDFTHENEHYLCTSVLTAARDYRTKLRLDETLLWDPVVKMLANLRTLYRHKHSFTLENLSLVLRNMSIGDVTALLVREQNAGLIIRKYEDRTVFESFEVSPPNETVMSTAGKLVCSYPGPAIAIPSETANDPDFISAISSFLAQMHTDVIDAAMPTTKKAGSKVEEIRNTPSPRFISELLTGILRGYGHPEDVDRITKRIADDVLWDKTLLPWRRSPMWLVIRVALQSTLKDHAGAYKSFLAFLMSRVLREAVTADMNSDTLAAMYKKLARRVYKIRESAPTFLQSQALEVIDLAQGLLEQRWADVQKAHASDGLAGWDPSSLDIPADTRLSLHNSRDYIQAALDNQYTQGSASIFKPNEGVRIIELDGYSAERLGEQIRTLGVLALFDFERAVEAGIDDWIANRPASEGACALVCKWIEQYSTGATRLYKGHPEQKSIMFLTLLELWVGLDKLAVRKHPLLGEYSPEVHEGVFEPLLLRQRQSIRRLEQAICYLRERLAKADCSLPSIFSDKITQHSFAVRYFNDHSALIDLKSRIEVKATKDRDKKKRELEDEQRLYRERVQTAASKEHLYRFNSHSGQNTHHKKKCGKCKLENLYKSMSIGVHEWPLPSDTSQAKATVFEIACPSVFGLWRQFTYFFLHDTCSPPSSRKKSTSAPEALLSDYPGLASFRDNSGFRRLTLASITKSWMKSHYSGVKVSIASVERVCLPNALRLTLFDMSDRIWISEPFRGCTIRTDCTFQIPRGRYHNLQYTVDGTLHTSNQVNALQSDCHRELGLQEYIAFGTLRAGGRIQWLNILRELRARTLSFSEEAVEILLNQTTLQMGPLSADGRRWEWHEVLQDDVFHVHLLEELETLQTSIQANWSEVAAMRIILLLLHRVLNWCSNPSVVHKALALLEKSRNIAHSWMKEIEHRLQATTGEESPAIQLRLWEMAAVVRSTFDVDPELSGSTSLNILLEAGMVFRDNIPPKSDLAGGMRDPASRIIVHDHRFGHRAEDFLVTRCRDFLHDAVTQYWLTYHPGSSWKCWNDRWLHTTSEYGQRIFFNILESQLLVDGKPLSRLPTTYASHPTYSRIFGKTIFSVVPPGNSDPSADFASKDPVNGYQIFFSLSTSGNLIIRARSVQTHRRYQLIPHTLFESDLPRPMVEDFTHWLSLDDGIIELRPFTDIWTPSPSNWLIHFSRRQMSVNEIRLVDVRSSTSRMIASRLSCLEQNGFIIVTYHPDKTLIELPRYRLDFQLNSQGELVCLTLPNMVVDSNQSPGIMVGLRNRLVLRDLVCDTRREVLIPIGEISFQMNGLHTLVSINPAATSDRRVQYFRYGIDESLGRLVGTSSSLHARLYKIYLTALTSYILPDRLTGRTGAEEALKELRSAACKSFISLDDESQDLLHKLANITPKREYYPSHLKVMQTVKWNALPALAQHNSFFTECQGILEFSVRLGVFSDAHGDKKVVRTLEEGPSSILVNRAAFRSMWYYPHEFHKDQPNDCDYRSRDVPNVVSESLVYSTSNLISHWPSNLSTTNNLLSNLSCLSNGKVGGRTNQGNTSLYVQYLISYPLSDTWIDLFDVLRAHTTSPYQVAFILCMLGYNYTGCSKVQHLIPTLIAFATRREEFLQLIHSPPVWGSYQISEGFKPDPSRLRQVTSRAAREFQFEGYGDVPRRTGETDSSLFRRRKEHYDERKEDEVKRIVDFVMRQWPSPDVNSRALPYFTIVKSADFINDVKSLFSLWYQNYELKLHLDDVQSLLNRIRGQPKSRVVPPEEVAYSFTPSYHCGARPPSFIALEEIMRRPPPSLSDLPARVLPPTFVPGFRTKSVADLASIDTLIGELGCSNDPVRCNYASDVDRSLDALKNYREVEEVHYDGSDTHLFCENQKTCDNHLRGSLHKIQKFLQSSSLTSNVGEEVMARAGLWPCLKLRPILETIASSNASRPPEAWLRTIKKLARSLLLSQKAHRMLRYLQQRNFDDLNKEFNVHASVHEVDDCDWLLIQADSDFLVREVQLAVAQEMISPSSPGNIVLQLNMGEGKSSVIVPFLGTTLANGTQLMRVVVLKSLARQMFSLLLQRLGGLTNRQILFLPFSRDVDVGESAIQQMRQLYEDARRSGAILVAQPEHMLSFKLMAVNKLVEGDRTASQLIQAQHWLDSVTRDVLDESDEIMHTRYQLIYTVGHQQILEHGSDRWSTVQQILSLVVKSAYDIRRSSPSGVDVVTFENGFPHIRILQSDAGKELINRVRFTDDTCQVLRQFIIGEQLSVKEKATLNRHCGGGTLWKTLLLLRGLLGQGILLYIFQARRWRVDFGLDLSRSLLAVPYRAKDVPSLRAEFGHPDVAILLTCLSYLYGGLSSANIDTCFNLLLKLDNPRLEYEEWVRTAGDIPEGLRDLSGVNLTDAEQRERVLFPHFRMNIATINFYLSRVVFPKAAKEFPEKLATTGWDIAYKKRNVTTGFSGTNDNRYLLPTSIIQADTPERLDTNARMLNLLLAPENDRYLAPSHQALSGRGIVDHLGSDIRVLLDVGAQIIEMSNAEVAWYWLSRRPDASAAVFFNERDELEVMTRDGTTESLSLSPFHGHMDECLVYLDDAHTRGTDLKLPTHWKACVTLGPKVTKDRLAQGCMRMRKLGRGQSVMFMAPPEIDIAIRKHAHKTSGEEVDSRDVVRWAMLETCAEIKHHIPHWVQQGVDFKSRDEGWQRLSRFEDPSRASTVIKKSWLQPEARTLEEMYGIVSPEAEHGDLTKRAQAIPDIWRRCETLGVTSLGDPRVEEEQEREVSHEIEREPEIQRPPKAEPANHTVHPDVETFVMSGEISRYLAFDRAFVPLRDGAGAGDLRTWDPVPKLAPLLATKDFLTTIESTANIQVGDYLRPLNWVVSSRHTRSLVIFSPHEVNELLPKIRQSKNVTLHIYTPRLTQFMKPTDDLQLYPIPSRAPTIPPSPLMITQLNLCAGQLYFSNHEEYRRITGFLGICTREDRDCQAENDGFVRPENRGSSRLSLECQFDKSPLSYLKLLVGSRRKGITYDPTHLGKTLNTRYLVNDDFEMSVKL